MLSFVFCGCSRKANNKLRIAERWEILCTDTFEVYAKGITDAPLSFNIDRWHKFEEDAGNRYLILNITFTNKKSFNSEAPIGPLMIVVNGSNFYYNSIYFKEQNPTYWCKFNLPLSPLAPSTINLVYKVPRIISGELFYFPNEHSCIRLGNINYN